MELKSRLRTVVVVCSLPIFSGARLASQQVNQPQSEPFRLEVNVNKVLVPVVVRDKQGHAVDGLEQGDFQVFDNGRPRAVSAFSVLRRARMEHGPETKADGGPQQPPPQRFMVLLFDDMHLSFENLAYAKKAAAPALDEATASSNLAAVVSTSGITNSGFTRNRAKLQQAMMSLRPETLFRNDGTGCLSPSPGGVGQQAGLAGGCNVGMKPQSQMATDEARQHAGASGAENRGVLDVRLTFIAVEAVVRSMAALPGQRTLILVSAGFPSDNPEVKPFESHLIDQAAKANVSINALDARGLVADTLPSPADILSELAYGTGGDFFHNSNDLGSGFKSLTEPPEVVYELELSLDGARLDGTYHRLKVKVNREDLDVRARRGYLVPEPERNKK